MRKSLSTIAILFFALSSQSEGSMVSYQFSGTVTSSSVSGFHVFTLQPDDQVVGSFAYDDAAAVTDIGLLSKDYSQPSSPSNFQISDTTHPYPSNGFGPILSDGSTTDLLSVAAPNHTDKSFEFNSTLANGASEDLLFRTPNSGSFISFSLSELPAFFATNPSGTLSLYFAGSSDFISGQAIINVNNVSPTPEPSTIALLSMGAIAFVVGAIRRRMAKQIA